MVERAKDAWRRALSTAGGPNGSRYVATPRDIEALKAGPTGRGGELSGLAVGVVVVTAFTLFMLVTFAPARDDPAPGGGPAAAEAGSGAAEAGSGGVVEGSGEVGSGSGVTTAGGLMGLFMQGGFT